MGLEEAKLPKDATGEERRIDTIGAAAMVGKLAACEITEDLIKKSNRTTSGKAVGIARAEKVTRRERSKIAKNATAARWE